MTVGPPSPSRVDSRLPPTISKHEFPLPLLGLLPKFYVNRCRQQSLVQISKCSLKNEVNPVPRIAEHCNIFILDLHLQSQRSTSTWETVADVCPHPTLYLALIKVVLCVFLEKQMSCGRTRRTGTWKKRLRLLQSFPSDCFGPPHRCRNDVIIWSPTWNCLLEFFGCLPPSLSKFSGKESVVELGRSISPSPSPSL